MIGFVSGEAARGAFVQAGEVFGCLRESDQKQLLRNGFLPAFFLNASDVEQVECANEADLRVRIDLAWRKDRAVRLTVLAFDASQSIETRRRAAVLADEFLQDNDCLLYVSFHLYARPFPSELEPGEISSLLRDLKVDRLNAFFELLTVRQLSIRGCSHAWDAIPASVFQDADQREEVRMRVVKTGAFYYFSSKGSDVNDTSFKLLMDPCLRGRAAQTREIVSCWAMKYREETPRELMYFDSDIEGETDASSDRFREVQSSYDAYSRVTKQRDAIKKELREGDQAHARELIDYLVTLQRQVSTKEQLAKSLCDLASYAKSHGDTDLHYELSYRATVEAPEDAWAFVQLGDGLMIRGDYQSALDAFDQAITLGDERAALIGKAETLKYAGQLNASLQLLDTCIQRYPTDTVSRNSRASTLAFFGRFEEALEMYNDLVARPLADAHAFGGRASVLGDLDRFDEAIKDHDRAIFQSDGADAIPHCAKADLLREFGRYEEAHDVLAHAPVNFAATLHVQNTRARVLRDEGRFDEAQELLAKTREKYPKDPGCRFAAADLYRKSGDMQRAREEFESIERDFPRLKYARNSLAALYIALGLPEKASPYLLAYTPASRADWVGFHLRGMMLLRQGLLDEAESVFASGLSQCPWRQQKPYFASGLAITQIRRKDFVAARSVLAAPGIVAPHVGGSLIAAIKIHSFAAEGNVVAARDELPAAKMATNPVVQEFVARLAARILESAPNVWESSSLVEAEWDALMALAA